MNWRTWRMPLRRRSISPIRRELKYSIGSDRSLSARKSSVVLSIWTAARLRMYRCTTVATIVKAIAPNIATTMIVRSV